MNDELATAPLEHRYAPRPAMRAFSVGISPCRIATVLAAIGLLCASGAAWAASPDGGVADGGTIDTPADGGGDDTDGGEGPEVNVAPLGVILTETKIESSLPLLEKPGVLAHFLGIEPGARYAAAEMLALPEALERIGYTLDGPPVLDGTRLRLRLLPLKVVRSIRVKGNFPLFDDEVIRHLSFASGTQLPPAQLEEGFFKDEAERVSEYLGREGYFGNKVKITRKERPKEHAVDVTVRVDLGGWARPYRLDVVRAQGNRIITDRELLDLFSHSWGIWGRFSLARMRDDARRAEEALKARGYPAARVLPDFDEQRDTDPARRRVSLPVKVSEKRKVEVKFVGNRQIGERDLRDQLTIFTKGAYDEIELEESARSIQRYYQQHGHFEARVTFRRRRVDPPGKKADAKPDPTAGVEEVTFLVEEGPELLVREVEVVGEREQSLTFNSEELLTRAALETKVFPKLGAIGLGSGGYLTAVQLQQDEQRLLGHYRNVGFPHVRVRTEVARDRTAFGGIGALGAASAAAGAEQNELYVRFYVEEGAREVVGSVDVEFIGEHRKSAAELTKLLRLGPDRPYTEDGIGEDAKRIVAAYRKLARPYVLVDFSGSTWNAEHTRIAVRFRVTEGAEVRFGEIIIRGNFRTRARVILQDLPFHPGEPFDLSKLEAGELNLQTHFIFDSVRVTPVGLASQRTTVPILVTVRERYIDYGGVLLSAGVSSDRLPYYAYVAASYIWSNLLGFGSTLEARGDFGFSKDAWGALVRYSDPRAFGPKWRLDMTGFVRNEYTNRLGSIFSYGASAQLTRYITPTVRTYLRYDFYRSQIAVSLTRLPGTNDRDSATDNTNTGKVLLGLVWDRRVGQDGLPNPLAPYKGWLLQAQIGWATPYLGGDNNFLILAGQALVIQPFKIRKSQFSFLANLRFDEGIPFDSSALPAVERYFAGGDTTTRGYEPDQLKTEIVRTSVSPLPGESAFRVIPQGGNVRVLSTLELQFPIAKTFLTLPIAWVGAIFYDAGTVFDGWNVFGGRDIKHSIGVSFLRLQTPIGPISVEYAYPLNQGPAEERWKSNPWYTHFPGRIHFNWGIPLARF